MLLQAGAEALKTAPGNVPTLAPLRSLRELHRRAARDLGIGPREDIESLLSEVQQLLMGISIMQVCWHPLRPTSIKPAQQCLASAVASILVHVQAYGIGQYTCFKRWQLYEDRVSTAQRSKHFLGDAHS